MLPMSFFVDTIIRLYSDFDTLPMRGADHGLKKPGARIRVGCDPLCSFALVCNSDSDRTGKRKFVGLLRNDLASPALSLVRSPAI